MSLWVKHLCEVPLCARDGANTFSRLFAPAVAHLDDREEVMTGVTQWIQAHRELIDAWRHYSEDKRRGSGPYLSERIGSSYDPLVVGFQRGD